MRKTMSPRLLMLAIAPVLLAASEPGEADPLAGAQTVSDEVLAAQRGGFAFQGMVIAFGADIRRSEEHTSELQSLMRISYAVFCLKKKNTKKESHITSREILILHTLAIQECIYTQLTTQKIKLINR